ncbi:MAG: hypothetical protein IPN53_17790 [Comamonadaceae bacterium]|nr:hypothetical protein [Comamonadaceae bacterium]
MAEKKGNALNKADAVSVSLGRAAQLSCLRTITGDQAMGRQVHAGKAGNVRQGQAPRSLLPVMLMR